MMVADGVEKEAKIWPGIKEKEFALIVSVLDVPSTGEMDDCDKSVFVSQVMSFRSTESGSEE